MMVRISKKLMALGALFAVALVAFAVFWKQSSAPAMIFEATPVEKGSIRQTVISSGVVQPQNRLEVKPQIAGRIETVLVREGQFVRKGQILAWMSSAERAALIDTARPKGPEEVKYWEEAYQQIPIVAPLDGIIILKNSERGQTVGVADAMLVMSDRLTVKANVDETDIGSIKIGLPVEITLDAYPQDKIDGKVSRIAYDAKTINSVTTYEVEVHPLTTPPYFKSGMTSNLTFVITAKDSALLVPIGAITKQDGRNFVYVNSPDKKPVLREVVTGLTDGKKIELISGMEENGTILFPKVSGKKFGRPAASSPLTPHGRGGRR